MMLFFYNGWVGGSNIIMFKVIYYQIVIVTNTLQVLSVARRDLKAVCQERSHVLDLICHETISCPKTAMTHRGTLITTPHRMTVSADGEREERYNIIDPLGPYTPEVDRCLLAGKDAQIRSAVLRRETAEIIDKTERIQRAVHQSVNDGVVQKIAETVTLKVCWLSWLLCVWLSW